MADRTDRVVWLLESIDATLKLLVKQQRASEPKAVASDRDLDGKYGDPILKFMPRDWTGPSFKSRAFSECPPDLLDMVAETFDYFARKADEAGEKTSTGKPVGDFKRQDAARARGWARRLRARGGQATPTTEAQPEGWDDAEPRWESEAQH